MQTILGSGGAIGNELAKALTVYTKDIKLVSRHPVKVNDTDAVFSADLLQMEAVREAVKGSEVVYLTAGLPYDISVWKREWPLMMQNVIMACRECNCRLVFFDNIYLYDGSNLNPIQEAQRINPPSEKGRVRAKLVEMIWEAKEQKGLSALIARCADFYGPALTPGDILAQTVIKPLMTGKTANWLVNDHVRHSFTYTPDAGKAVALLGNSSQAFGQTWHLPTAKNPPTGKEWVQIVASALGVKARYRKVSKMMVKLMGLFNPTMKNIEEMLYQYDKDYVFNSDKFERTFSLKPTEYEKGIRDVISANTIM